MSKRRMALYVILAALVAIQFVPVDRSNPSATEDMQVAPNVSEVLRQSCYDCHSNETSWPWYSYVAPVSWMLAHHVHEGREKLNFSTWNTISEEKRLGLMHEVWEEISEGEMPLRGYLVLHPEAKLSSVEMEVLGKWSK